MMDGLSDVARDERTARIALSMLVEPNDPVTGRLVAHLAPSRRCGLLSATMLWWVCVR